MVLCLTAPSTVTPPSAIKAGGDARTVSAAVFNGTLDPLGPDFLARLKKGALALTELEQATQALMEQHRESAVETRGLDLARDVSAQGCDLVTPKLGLLQAVLDLAASSPQRLDEIVAEVRTRRRSVKERIAAIATKPCLAGTFDPACAEALFRREQIARTDFTTGTVPPEAAELMRAAMLATMCEQDLSSGAWLQTVGAKTLAAAVIETEKESARYKHLRVLLLHADHLPELQEEAAERLLIAGTHSRLGAQLADRAAVNRGAPQVYGTGIICNGSVPEIMNGLADEKGAVTRRAKIGLPPLSAALTRAGLFCQ